MQPVAISQAIQTGLEHHQAGRLPEAERSYQQVLQIDPDNPDALYLLGTIARQVGKNEIAVQLFDKALSVRPEHADALYNRGVALTELGRYDEALASYDEALKIKPDHVEALTNRGYALHALKRLDDAAASYRRALEIKPEYTMAHVNLGHTLRDLGHLDSAVASIGRGLTFNPDFTSARSNLGDALKDFGHLHQKGLRLEGVTVGSRPVGALTLRFLASIDEVASASWNGCVPDGNLFSRHEFLAALEHSGSTGVQRGILPCHAVLEDEAGRMVAAAPGVIRWNNLGETGPELLWTKMLHERQLKYFPNYQLGIPLVAVSTPKLLVAPGWPRDLMGPFLLQQILKVVETQTDFASFHVSRFDEDELPWVKSAGMLIARTPSSVWRNRGYSSFDDWLAALHGKRRYYIRQERKSANESGLAFRILRGTEITPALWEAFHRGHLRICARHGAPLLLAPEFHPAVATSLGEQVMLFAAFDGGEFVAGAACAHQGDTLHVHTWSMLVDRPNLSFELVMHRPIAWAIETGVNKVDAGLAMAYKIFRGFLAEPLYGGHWLRDPELAGQAGQMIERYDRDTYSRFGEGRVRLFRRDSATIGRD